MALTKETTIDKIEIVGEYKIVQVRESIIIKEDGVKISEKYNRKSILPTDDTSNEDSEIQNVCNLVHTQAIKDAYIEFIENAQLVNSFFDNSNNA